MNLSNCFAKAPFLIECHHNSMLKSSVAFLGHVFPHLLLQYVCKYITHTDKSIHMQLCIIIWDQLYDGDIYCYQCRNCQCYSYYYFSCKYLRFLSCFTSQRRSQMKTQLTLVQPNLERSSV